MNARGSFDCWMKAYNARIFSIVSLGMIIFWLNTHYLYCFSELGTYYEH